MHQREATPPDIDGPGLDDGQPPALLARAVGRMQQRLWALNACGAVLLIGVLVMIVTMSLRNSETDAWVAHAMEVRHASATLQNNILDAETNDRVWLLSEEPALLARRGPTQQDLTQQDLTQQDLTTAQQRLAALVRHDPGQRARLAALLPLIQQCMASLSAAVAAAQSAGPSGRLDRALLRRNAALVDTIRRRLTEFDQAETGLLANRQAAAASVRRQLVTGSAGALALALLLGAITMLLHHREAATLREANARLAGTVTDRTDALRASERRFRQVFHDSPIGLCLATAKTRRIVAANPMIGRMLGYEEADLLGRQTQEFAFPDDLGVGVPVTQDAEPGPVPAEKRYLTRSGAVLCARVSVVPLAIPGEGEPLVLCTAEDVTHGKEIEAALRDSEARMRLAVEAAGLGAWEEDMRRRAIRLDGPAAAHIGATLPANVWLDGDGPELAAWTALIHPEDAAARAAATQSLLDGGSDLATSEFRVRLSDGTWAWISAVGTIAERDPQTGRPLRVLTILQDIAPRKETEMELRHAQRLEAVGQLTGGLAHDFNNLIGAILGHTEFLLDLLPEQSEERQLATEVLDCALNGASLTQRLLAFARRQPLQPAIIDLNEYLPVHVSLLQRTLGDNITVATVLEPGLWLTHADPSQIADVLLNLAINARDAMPHGGRLTIATANAALDAAACARFAEAAPGDYVVLSVTDTGLGMTQDVLARAMEPFFTTKPPGKGSGLGLSTIYGFARQTGGHMCIESAPGEGTTVRVFLPRSDGEKGAVATRPPRMVPLPRGNEAILVVDDNDSVRTMAARNLAALGYRVRLATDGPTALAIMQAGERFDMMFTDMVMPNGLSGYQLAKAARVLQPDLPVLFTTGFASAEEGAEPLLDVDALRKPYRRRELAERVRATLDGTTRRQAPAPAMAVETSS